MTEIEIINRTAAELTADYGTSFQGESERSLGATV